MRDAVDDLARRGLIDARALERGSIQLTQDGRLLADAVIRELIA